MALRINNKAGILATFAAVPELKEVHIHPNGEHHFNKFYFAVYAPTPEDIERGELPEGIVTLARDAEELTMTEKELKAAEAARLAATTPA